MFFEGSRRMYIIAGTLLVLLFTVGLVRDLLLGKKPVAPDRGDGPPIVVEGLDVVRDLEGERWRMKAERVEKRGDVSDAEALDVVIEASGGVVWTVRSEKGRIFEASEDVQLESAVGRVKHTDGDLDWSAPRAEWNNSDSVWIFPEGFQAEDESLRINGDKGRMTMAGMLDVEKGAVVTWKGSAR